MAVFQVGEMVRAVIEAGRVDSVEGDALVVAVGAAQIMLPLDERELVRVERMAPAEWPPQGGDVWRAASGVKWFASASAAGDVMMVSSPSGTQARPEKVLGFSDGPLTLVYREGWTTAVPVPVQPDPDPDDLATLVAGLRELADFYEANPAMPMPIYPSVTFDVTNSTAQPITDDAAGQAVVEAAAALLGVACEPRGSDVDGRRAVREFAGLRFDIHYCSDTSMSRSRSAAAAEPEPSTEDGEPGA